MIPESEGLNSQTAIFERVRELLLSARLQLEVVSPNVDFLIIDRFLEHGENALAHEGLVEEFEQLHVQLPNELVMAGQIMNQSLK